MFFTSARRQAKQRPLTDPLIVHVPDTISALAVVDFEGEGGGGAKARRLLDLLGEKLWPGELLLVGGNGARVKEEQFDVCVFSAAQLANRGNAGRLTTQQPPSLCLSASEISRKLRSFQA